MSLSWISGGAIDVSSALSCARWRARPRWMRRMVGSSADRKAEAVARREGRGAAGHFARRSADRSSGCASPASCRWTVPVNGLPFGAITSAPAFTQRLASGMSAVMTTSPLAGALRDPVVGGVHAGTGGDALDQRILRHADETAGDHADRQLEPRARHDRSRPSPDRRRRRHRCG